MKKPATKLTFITGTDTGSGKTVFTAHAVHALRGSGVNALAVKPFASGGLEDSMELQRAQGGLLGLGEITPFHLVEPVAPLVAARLEGRQIPLESVVEHLQRVAGRCDHLLVEGAGGLLCPLGEGYGLLEMAKELDGKVVVVGKNRLGIINHMLLTLHRIRCAGLGCPCLVLVDEPMCSDLQQSNLQMIEELSGLPVVRIPHLPDPRAYGILKICLESSCFIFGGG